MQIVSECQRRNFGVLAVIRDALVIVRSSGAAKEENLAILARPAARDAKARRARMRGQLGPFNFVWIFLIDPAQPALVGRNIARATLWTCLSSIHDHHVVIGQAASHTEGGRARERSRLTPRIFFDIVDLHIIHRAIL